MEKFMMHGKIMMMMMMTSLLRHHAEKERRKRAEEKMDRLCTENWREKDGTRRSRER